MVFLYALRMTLITNDQKLTTDVKPFCVLIRILCRPAVIKWIKRVTKKVKCGSHLGGTRQLAVTRIITKSDLMRLYVVLCHSQFQHQGYRFPPPGQWAVDHADSARFMSEGCHGKTMRLVTTKHYRSAKDQYKVTKGNTSRIG